MIDTDPAAPPTPASTVTSAPAAPNGAHTPEPAILVPSAPPSSASRLRADADRSTEADRPTSEPLARIEDKTSRIEEKLARSEAATQRVVDRFELAVARMGEMASQSELAAVRGEVAFIARRVRKAPGVTALAVTAVATALLTALVMLLVLRYAPGLLPPR